MVASMDRNFLSVPRRSRVITLLLLGAFFITYHHLLFSFYPSDDLQDPPPSDQIHPGQGPASGLKQEPPSPEKGSHGTAGIGGIHWSDFHLPKVPSLDRNPAVKDAATQSDSSSSVNQEPQPATHQPAKQQGGKLKEQSENESSAWKAKAQALESRIHELEAKLKLQLQDHDIADKSRPYRIRLEDDPVGIEGSGILEELLDTKKTADRRNSAFRNIQATRQHGGSHNEILYMQSDRQIEIPPWDKNRPLPAWWKETEQFIKDMNARPNMGPMPEKYILPDVCIWLGYNNIRYILEMGALFTELSNRTFVFPDYVYMRACDEPDLCRLFGTLEDISYQPENKFARWTFPMDEVWDMTEIRKRHNIITTSEFVKIQLFKHGIVVEDPKEWIESRGGEYGAAQPLNVGMAFLDVNNELTMESHDFLDEWYPWGSNNRGIDDLDPAPYHGVPPSRAEAKQELQQQLQNSGSQAVANIADPGHVRMKLWGYRFGPDMSLNTTFDEIVPIRWAEDYNLTFYDPAGHGIIPVGFKQYYGSIESDYLHWIEGLHRFSAPPCQFSTEAGRDRYAQIVLHEIKLHPGIEEARDYLLAKLRARIGGPQKTYQAVHLRQGDMLYLAYFPDIKSDEFGRIVAYTLWRHRTRVSDRSDAESQLNREGLFTDSRPDECDSDVRKMKRGEVVWSLDGTRRVAREGEERPANWDEMMGCLDKTFYFATDSDDPTMIEALRSYGGFLLDDLIDTEFLNKHMKIAAFGDLKGIMDQWMMANSRHFLGSYMSSLTGGALNQRLYLEKPRSSSSFLNFHPKWSQVVDDLYYQNKLASLSDKERKEWIAEYEARKAARQAAPQKGFQDSQGDVLL